MMSQDRPVFFKQLLLIHHRRPIAPTPLRCGDGGADVL
jgi:hypothetical protein